LSSLHLRQEFAAYNIEATCFRPISAHGSVVSLVLQARFRVSMTLFEIEYLSRAERAVLRANDSPLSVAFADARLRDEGLAGDTIGEAIAFFGVSEMEMHRILCFCHHGDTMSADAAAVRVRAAAVRAAWNRPLGLSPMLISGVAAAMIAIGALAV
jgi:hypothetical protein